MTRRSSSDTSSARVQEGASSTGGIHKDLVIRLDAAARFTEGGEPLPVEFERAFGEGYAAGQASG